MLTYDRIHGILPAIPTPVKTDDTVDVAATRHLLKYLMERGINGVVPLGGTGEYGALSKKERVTMTSVTASVAKGHIPVVAGVLDPGYHDAIQAGKEYAQAGADALLVITPYYTNPTQEGVRDYFLRYADASPVPVLLYEIPYRTRIAMAPEVIHELSRHENIIGMKACNTDMWHYLRTVAGIDKKFAMLSGEDHLFPLHMAAGAKGGIVVTASLLPSVWQEVYRLGKEGKDREALALHAKLIPFLNLAFAETNPGPMKSVWDRIGVNAPSMLAPLLQAKPDLSSTFRGELEKLLAEYEKAPV